MHQLQSRLRFACWASRRLRGPCSTTFPHVKTSSQFILGNNRKRERVEIFFWWKNFYFPPLSQFIHQISFRFVRKSFWNDRRIDAGGGKRGKQYILCHLFSFLKRKKQKKGKGTLGPSVYRRINSFRWPLFTNSRSVGRSAENKRGAHAIRKRKRRT